MLAASLHIEQFRHPVLAAARQAAALVAFNAGLSVLRIGKAGNLRPVLVGFAGFSVEARVEFSDDSLVDSKVATDAAVNFLTDSAVATDAAIFGVAGATGGVVESVLLFSATSTSGPWSAAQSFSLSLAAVVGFDLRFFFLSGWVSRRFSRLGAMPVRISTVHSSLRQKLIRSRIALSSDVMTQ